MSARSYLIYDVFTDRPLAGNPLAIVLDAQDLDTAGMQAIAREFNLSETVFLLPPEDPSHRARIRIFTPTCELPFAGHPTVGTAVALAEREGGHAFVLAENVGPVQCTVARREALTCAAFTLPLRTEPIAFDASVEAIARALGLAPADIGFEDHRLGLWSAGVPYYTVPVSGLEAAGRAVLDARQWLELAPPVDGMVPAPYVYCRQSVGGAAYHARMFAPFEGIEEDPATGSAAAALTGAIGAHEQLEDGTLRLSVEQGVEMGRPSWIEIELDVTARKISAARIGGGAVKVAEGMLFA